MGSFFRLWICVVTQKWVRSKEICVLRLLLKKTKSFTINVCLVNFRLNAKKRKRRLLWNVHVVVQPMWMSKLFRKQKLGQKRRVSGIGFLWAGTWNHSFGYSSRCLSWYGSWLGQSATKLQRRCGKLPSVKTVVRLGLSNAYISRIYRFFPAMIWCCSSMNLC